jgi:putative membrane protein
VSAAEYIPFCGTVPVPGALAWNFTSVLIVALPAGAWACCLLEGRRWVATAGWLTVAVALGSPLCHLSVALFSARVAQHMIVVLVAAPLIAWTGRGMPRPGRTLGLTWAVAGFAVVLWAWHLPGPYDAALRSDAVYWLMHFTLLATAIWLWHGLRAAPLGAALLAGLLTALQMSLLGAVLTFAPRALFPVHATTTAPWGLTPLEDQQLGGLIMWIPAGLLFSFLALAAAGWRLRRTEVQHGQTLRSRA